MAMNETHKPFGPVAAGFLAAGVGSVVLGLLTVLAEASAGAKDFLDLYKPVGPLAGKTIFAVVAYIIAWVVLGVAYKGKDPEPRKVFMWTWILLAIGFLMTFPTFFLLFEAE